MLSEGRFIPNSYFVTRGTKDIAVLGRAFDAMERCLATQWARRESGLPYKTPYQALILASIVEREAARPSERERVAGVFVRRLKRGIPLQADPTVIYGLDGRFDGSLRRGDLRAETPYNTYVHQGLPPTPIAMPGVAALRGVLHPGEGKAMYFVARGDGSHEFSETLEQHNQAVRRYQLWKDSGAHMRGRSSPSRASKVRVRRVSYPTLRRFLGAMGLPVRITREPGGTSVGEEIRTLLLKHRAETMNLDTELLLMLRPARLTCKRSSSGPAGRGLGGVGPIHGRDLCLPRGGRGVALARVAAIEEWVQGNFRPILRSILMSPCRWDSRGPVSTRQCRPLRG